MVYIQENLNYSFYEISEILKHIPIEYNEKLPEKIRDLINENKIDNGFIYNEDKTLDNQEMLHDTKVLISLLYRNYWCDEETKEKLKREDENLLEIHEKKLQEKYNSDNIFKNKKQNNEVNSYTDSNSMVVVEYKESIFKKILDKIKEIFKFK